MKRTEQTLDFAMASTYPISRSMLSTSTPFLNLAMANQESLYHAAKLAILYKCLYKDIVLLETLPANSLETQ